MSRELSDCGVNGHACFEQGRGGEFPCVRAGVKTAKYLSGVRGEHLGGCAARLSEFHHGGAQHLAGDDSIDIP